MKRVRTPPALCSRCRGRFILSPGLCVGSRCAPRTPTGQTRSADLARISHHLTVEARHKPAMTALRLLAVRNDNSLKNIEIVLYDELLDNSLRELLDGQFGNPHGKYPALGREHLQSECARHRYRLPPRQARRGSAGGPDQCLLDQAKYRVAAVLHVPTAKWSVHAGRAALIRRGCTCIRSRP